MSAEVENKVGQMRLISAVIGFYNICLNKLKEYLFITEPTEDQIQPT